MQEFALGFSFQAQKRSGQPITWATKKSGCVGLITTKTPEEIIGISTSGQKMTKPSKASETQENQPGAKSFRN